jgi:hypothetical protein
MVDIAPASRADRWSYNCGPGTEPDLVVRADTFLPWRGAANWRIGKRGRERLLAALPVATLVPSTLTLARRRAITQAQRSWEILPERAGGRQSERTAQYRCVVRAPDGTPAFTAEARLVLPDGYQHPSVQASAALRIRFGTSAADWQSHGDAGPSRSTRVSAPGPPRHPAVTPPGGDAPQPDRLPCAWVNGLDTAQRSTAPHATRLHVIDVTQTR